MEEVRRALALLFKRKGSLEMTEKDFVMSVSMDLRWFPPKDAQKLLSRSVQSGLLLLQNGKLRPSFDISSVQIPLNFAPSETALRSAPAQDRFFDRFLEHLQTHAKLDRKALISVINKKQESLDLDIEVAALLVARELGVPINAHIADAEALLRSRH